MGVNTQRLLMITILLNLLLSFISVMYESTDTTSIEDQRNAMETSILEQQEGIQSDNPESSKNIAGSTSIGDLPTMGQFIWKALLGGFSSIETSPYATEYEQTILQGINYTLLFLKLMMILEVILIIYSKKVT